MALKLVIDRLEDVEEPLRSHYVAENGKFCLATAGEHPKVSEFRGTNIAQARELDELRPLKTKFADVDPDEYRALKAKAAAGDAPAVVALRAELATERAARATAQATADASVLKSTIVEKFTRAGGRPNAVEFMVGKAKDLFTVENGVLVGKVFDPDKPGEKLTVDAFLTAQVRESDFAFLPSSGGGANPRPGGGGRRPGVNELVNPTPQQLGEHAAAIKRGDMKVVYTT